MMRSQSIPSVQNNQSMTSPPPPSPLQWGIPDKIQELLCDVKNIFFERDTVE